MADAPFFEVFSGDLAADASRLFVSAPAFEVEGAAGEKSPPTVTLISPAEGVIEPDDVVVIEVTDAQDFAAVLLAMRCGALGLYEVVHDGTSFAPSYSAAPNSFQAIADGWRFSMRRAGGWPAGVNFSAKVFAIDLEGSAA